MSSPLAPEMLDHIVDQMRDDPTTLKTCCLISKSWIQRTQKLLFTDVDFCASGPRLESWKNAFPDSANSPAHHTRSLSIRHPHLIKAADANTMLTFSGVECLDVITCAYRDERVSLAPLHGFSSVLRSLYLSFISLPDSEIFGLVCSFPLLDDLTLVSLGRGQRRVEWNAPSTSPRLAGSLKLETVFEGIQSITRRLLDLPNGIHFTKIAVPWLSEEDVKSTMDLVLRCADTLQSLDIMSHRSGTSPSLSPIPGCDSPPRVDPSESIGIDLSQVSTLREAVFRCGGLRAEWIIRTLHNTEPRNLQRLSLELPRYSDIEDAVWETVHQEWLDLDSLLVQFWVSHSLRLKVMSMPEMGEEDLRDYVTMFLPEMTERGIIDLAMF